LIKDTSHVFSCDFSVHSTQGGSHEHLSFITNSDFNDFAFILQFKHEQCIIFGCIWCVPLLRLATFACVCILQETY